jgi:hypothetical protein
VTALGQRPGANRVNRAFERASTPRYSPRQSRRSGTLGYHIGYMDRLEGAAFPMIVIAGRRSFVEKNRDWFKRFMQAYSEANLQFICHKEKSVAMYTQRMKQEKPRRKSTKPTDTLPRAFLSKPSVTEACAGPR